MDLLIVASIACTSLMSNCVTKETDVPPLPRNKQTQHFKVTYAIHVHKYLWQHDVLHQHMCRVILARLCLLVCQIIHNSVRLTKPTFHLFTESIYTCNITINFLAVWLRLEPVTARISKQQAPNPLCELSVCAVVRTSGL